MHYRDSEGFHKGTGRTPHCTVRLPKMHRQMTSGFWSWGRLPACRSDSAGWKPAPHATAGLLHVHDEDVVAAAAVGDERQTAAVRRPRRVIVLRRVRGQVAQPAAVGVHQVNLVV